MNSFLPIGFPVKPCNTQYGVFGLDITKLFFLSKGVYPLLLIMACIFMPTFSNNLQAQSSTCVVDSVGNENGDPWSEECYLNDDCEEQGNPCQANDVTMIGVFVADSTGGPVAACTIGDTVEVLLWGTFSNNTGTNRYAIRSRVEVWINGNFYIELNSCSFDVLAPGMTDVALVGSFDYVCGSQIQLFNSWIGWSTSAAQCEDPMAPNFNDVCGEYSPSKCSKSLQFIDFLSPNFSYDCGESDPGTTEICFTNLTTGGVPPLTYLWDFGDGGMSTDENPCHTYNATTGSFTVILEVTDSNGIMASSELLVNLDSLVCCNLVLTCPSPDGGVFACADDVPAADTGLIIVTDSCGAVTITFDEDTVGTGCVLDTMFITRTYFVDDGTVIDSCVQIFSVVDDEGPVITCPADTNVQCASLVPVPDTSAVDATDNCDNAPVITFVSDVTSGLTCANRFVITRTYMATDACGNTTTCAQIITVFDNTIPAITCPANVTLECTDSTLPNSTEPGMATATDNCGATPLVTFTDVTMASAVCLQEYTINRTWLATDECGNTNTCIQIITVDDSTLPAITCPANITVSCDGNTLPPGTGIATATDNCDSTITPTFSDLIIPSIICSQEATILRTWTATDDCGNSTTCVQTIVVDDSTPPVIMCPPNVTIDCAAISLSAGVPVVTDNCDTLPTVTFLDLTVSVGSCLQEVTISRTWTATDDCGNSSTCIQTLSLTDTLPPAIICPPDATLECSASTAPNSTIPGMATATDSCDLVPIVTFSDLTVASACPQEYTITRTWTATDDCDNTSTCVQIISIEDNTAPVLSCPVNIIVDCEDSTLPPDTGEGTAIDNCDATPVVGFSDEIIEGVCPQEFTVMRTWTATDACMNSSTCLQIVSVQDTTPPSFNPNCMAELEFFTSEGSECPADAMVSLEVGDIVGEAEMWTVGGNTIPGLNGCLFDNCGNPDSLEARVDSIIISGDSCLRIISIHFTILNDCDSLNVNLFTTVVSIIDDAPPVIDCPEDMTIDCEASSSPDVTGMATATDNCQLVGITSSDVVITGECPQEMTIIRTWTADDNCGNSSTCIQTLTVIDTTPPVLICPEVISPVECSDSGTPMVLFQEDFDGIGGPTAGGAGTYTFPAGWLKRNVDNLTPAAQVAYVNEAWERREDFSFNVTDSVAFSTSWYSPVGTANDWMWTPPIGVLANSTLNWNAVTYDPSFRDGYEVRVMVSPNIPTGGTGVIGNQITNSTVVFSIAQENTAWTPRSVSLAAYAGQTIYIGFRNNSLDKFLLLLDDISVTAEASGPVFADATATDACDPEPVVTFSDVTIEGECAQEYTVTRTWVATDACGNSSTCSATVEVIDTTAPVIVCPADLTIECQDSTSPDSTGFAIPRDDCDSIPEVTFSDLTIGSQVCLLEYSIVRTWVATDACGNSSTCTQLIMVEDNTPPLISCPADTIVTCDGSISPDSTGMPQVTDNCDLAPVVISLDVTFASESCDQEYTIMRTWLATDACGNSSSCMQTISVVDTVAPVVDTICNREFDFYTSLGSTCPMESEVSIFNNIVNGIPIGVNEEWMVGNNTIPSFAGCFTDNCDDPDSLIVFPFSLQISGDSCLTTFTLGFNVQDDCGNISDDIIEYIIRIHDDVAPIITCPVDVTIECTVSTDPDSIGLATAIDDCRIAIAITSVDSIITGECPQEMIILRTWTADDGCGNISTCLQTITVQDTTAPGFISGCQAIFEFFTSDTSDCPDSALISLTIGDIVGENESWSVGGNTIPTLNGCLLDNCSNPDSLVARVDDIIIDGDSCDISFTVLFTIIDQCGNESDSQFVCQVIIHDDVAPVLTCPADLTINCEESTSVDSTGLATAIDDCQLNVLITSSDSIVPGLCLQEMTIFRTWTADDNCGNSSSCVQIISVQDTTPPVASFIPPDITIECDGNIDSVLAEVPIFVDNCDTLVPAFGSIEVLFNEACPQAPTYIQAWSGVDDCGNSTTVGRTVVVIDTTAPVIICPADLTIECTDDTSPDSNGVATATDNCDSIPVVDFADVTIAGECPQEYTINRTWTATDECENSATCVQTIVVDDSTPPVIVCPAAITVECANLLPPPSIDSVSATDNCGMVVIAHIGDALSDLTCVNRFTVTRTYSATDECGNTSTCTQMISVFDDTPPAITCPANLTVQCATLVPPVNPATVISSDNCGGIPVNSHVGDVITNMTCANRFTLTRTYRATDECGNSSTCNQTITVFDNTPPMITCPANLTVQCASQVPAPNTGLVISSDNCSGATTIAHVGDVITNMTCVNRFTLTRTYRATDVCGNSATCNQIITVFDNTPPSITCPANITVQCAALVPPNNPATVITSDNCGGSPVVTFVSDVITNMTCINRFTLTRTYRSTDACGNSATCAQVITVFDNTPPVIEFADVLIDDIPPGGTLEVQCFGQDPEWELPVFDENSVDVTDNCAGNITVTFSQVLIDEGDCEVDGYINRYRLTWNATDACGNSSSAFIFMELIDTIPPVIEGVPADTIVNCDDIPEPPTVFATDECLCACIILFDQSDPAPGCQDGQVITRTWTATDDCGNETVEVQFITLVDEEGPVLEIMLPELAGITQDTTFEYTCNEGGIPAFFDELSAEWVSSPVSCGGLPMISFTSTTLTPRNCKFFGYVEQRKYEWIGVDQCGNQTILSVTVHLIDNEPPVLVGVPDMACIGEEIENVEAIDNCGKGAVIYWDVPIPNPCGDGMAMRRTYEGFDPCGNTVRDTTIMIPNDHAHPLMEFINPILADLEPGEMLQMDCDAENGQFTSFGPEDVNVEDACFGGVTVTFTETILQEGDCTNGESVALVELSWVASDVCGNLSELVVMARISDQTPPVFVDTDDDITIGCNDELPGFFAVDNCGDVIVTTQDSIIPGECEFEYIMLRTLTATDECGNVTLMRQTIHVGDGSGPVLEGIVEELCDDVSIPQVSAFDPCAGVFVEVSMTEDTLDMPCRDGFVLERTWTAFDVCGNSTQVIQHIVVGDETSPEILIPTHSVIRRFLDIPEIQLINLSQSDIMNLLDELDDASIFVTDDCDQVIIPEFFVEITYAEDCEEEGFFEHRVYTWIATDVCGNSTSISFEVDIMDDIAPGISDVPEDTTIICDQLPPAPGITTDDPAEPVTVEYTQSIIETAMGGVFVVVRTWVATDACGNSASASQTINWIPDTFLECDIVLPSEVECNSHGVLIESDLLGGLGAITYMWEIEGEKCFIQEGQGTPSILIYVGWSDVEITLTVTDEFGCVSTCSIVLPCVDPAETVIGTDPQSRNTGKPDVKGLNTFTKGHLENLSLWPNPTSGNVNFSFESPIEQDIRITLTDMMGQEIMSKVIPAHKGLNTRKIESIQFPEGSYLMQIVSQHETHSKVLVILHN